MSLGGLCFNACNCKKVIGYDEVPWTIVAVTLTYDQYDHNSFLSSATTQIKLDECAAIFCGNQAQCGLGIRWNISDWPLLKTYIENGGRLFIASEHSGNGPGFPGFSVKCEADMDKLNSFLTAIGSSIRYIGNDYNASGPPCSSTYYGPGAAAIMSGINFTGERFAEWEGGTTLFIGNVAGGGGSGSGLGKVAGCIEQLGNGFVATIGDSNSMSCPGYGEFIRRFVENPSEDMI